MRTTISDLKRELGPGLGLRSSKFLLEVPVPGLSGRKINILCKATALPERNIGTVDLYSKGRVYKVRGETEFPRLYNVSVIDDSDMNIRRLFDSWLTLVDNTKPHSDGILGVMGNNLNNTLNLVSNLLSAANTLKSSFEFDNGLSFVLNGITGVHAAPVYQTEINIWQLDAQGNKVYGYQLQNAFPSGLGTVELDEGQENTLSEFSIDFSYSEFIPLEDRSTRNQIGDALLGDNVKDIVTGVENLFD